MADIGDIYELEQLAVQPGTYVNPQTEVVIIVEDSATVDQEVFEEEGTEGTEWVRVSDEVPVDETLLEEALEEFQSRRHPGAASQASSIAVDDALDEDDDPELEPDPDLEDEELSVAMPEAGAKAPEFELRRPVAAEKVALQGPSRPVGRPLLLPAGRHPGLHDPGLQRPRPLLRVRRHTAPASSASPPTRSTRSPSSTTSTTSGSRSSPTPITPSPRPTAPGPRRACTARSTWASSARPS